jgi:L-rhamnose mutarotase
MDKVVPLLEPCKRNNISNFTLHISESEETTFSYPIFGVK